MADSPKRPFVVARLRWLTSAPTNAPTAGITAYRSWIGPEDLFSVFVKFSTPAEESGRWQSAKIYALVEAMESRVPAVGRTLVLTAGLTPVAEAEVLGQGEE